MTKPIEIIKAIRQSFGGSETIYLYGSCLHFFNILKSIFPEAKPYMAKSKGHIVSLINGEYYDISGAVKGDYIPADEEVLAALTKRKFDINDCSYFVPEWFAEDNYIKNVAANNQ